MDQDLLGRIRRCSSLPSLPPAAVEVIRLTEDDSAGASAVAHAISRDPALSGSILHVVNASVYGHRQNIGSLRYAVSYLGLHSVRVLVLGFTIARDWAKRKPGGFNHLSYWRRSVYAASAASILADKLLQGQQETALLAALLMDIGMLALDGVLGQEYGAICGKAASHAELADLERQALGITHADVARALAEDWGLPATLALPMAHHDRPEAVEDCFGRKMTEVVAMAARCADIFIDAKPATSIADVRRLCMERYKINELACDAMLCAIGQRIRELAALFDIRLEDEVTYEAILKKADDELLALTLAGLEDQPGAERRRSYRVRRDNGVSILPCGVGTVGRPIAVHLRDVSSHGIGLLSPHKLEPGSRFIVQLPQKTGKTVSLLYVVARCLTEGKQFIVGGQLVSILNPSDVADHPAPAKGAIGKIEAATLR